MRILILLLLPSLLAACTPGLSTTRTLDQPALASHRTVAVLPFEVTQDRFRLRDINYGGTDTTQVTRQRVQQKWTAQQQWESRTVAYQLQELLHNELQAHQPARGYTVQFQEVRETNRRLQQAGITYENLPDQDMSALQRALGVDAVLSGQTMLYQPMPNGVGLVARLLLDEPLLSNQSVVPSNQAITNLTLHDCRNGQLTWRFDFERTGTISLKPERLAQDLVRAATPSFPYCRK